ncbi:MAG: hypothetical protein QOJ94_2273 [Sphingomonadales bacterium]|jgi:hypothetical protein|nr:hypothetical protein [Sphingomonadales bacterium]
MTDVVRFELNPVWRVSAGLLTAVLLGGGAIVFSDSLQAMALAG